MAMKIVYFYNQAQQGWTETYYSVDTNPQYTVESLTDAQLANFIGFRAPLTGLFGVRASDTNNPRNSFFRPLNNAHLFSTKPYSSKENPDPASTDLVIKVFDASGRKKNVFLRGLRDEDVLRDTTGFANISANLLGAIRAWFQQCSKLGYTLRTLITPPAGGQTWDYCTTARASTLGDAYTDLTVGTLNFNPTNGMYIRFQGVPTNDLPAFPKFTQVTNWDGVAKVLTIPARWRSPNAVATPKLRFTLVTYLYTSWIGFNIGSFGEHKTGRPFGSARGRSRVATRSR